MQRLSLLLIVCLAMSNLFINACCKPGMMESLNVTLHPQETERWCWAASAQMVMHYLGNNVAQCTQANNHFDRDDCCNIDLCPPPTELPCDQPGGHPCACPEWPEFDRYGFSFKRTTNAPLSWKDLKKEISSNRHCGKRPFAFTWSYSDGSGHMMVAIGYKTVNGVDHVEILDPWAPCIGDLRFITYDFYDQSPEAHTHWDDFYNIKVIRGKNEN